MAELMSVHDKVCIITGSASGLGKSYAEILLENGVECFVHTHKIRS